MQNKRAVASVWTVNDELTFSLFSSRVRRSDPDVGSERSGASERDAPGLQRHGGRNPHGPHLTGPCGPEVASGITHHPGLFTDTFNCSYHMNHDWGTKRIIFMGRRSSSLRLRAELFHILPSNLQVCFLF